MVIFKSAAYSDLSDEDLEEILSCYNEPVLRAYIPCALAFDYRLSLRTQSRKYAGICKKNYVEI
jgi:hypothetical protein